MLDQNIIDQLFETVGSDTGKELVDIFIAEARDRVVQIGALTEQGNVQDLAREAHSMKSSSLTYGLPELSECARLLEMSCKEGTLDPELATRVRDAADAGLQALADYAAAV